jgi:subtilisin family serine protease
VSLTDPDIWREIWMRTLSLIGARQDVTLNSEYGHDFSVRRSSEMLSMPKRKTRSRKVREVTAQPDRIIAVVSPRSRGGTSLFDMVGTIHAGNVQQFHSDDTVIANATAALRKAGFEVLDGASPVTISIAAPRKLFEDVFGATFVLKKAAFTKDIEVEFLAPSETLQVPASLSGLIEGIAVAHPPELHAESPLPPLAQPEPGAYRYLFVPDDVGLIINADRVHRLGATGKGVNVAMVDTGFYPHPFYNWHGYSVQSVVLGPGAADPGKDVVGHGTGEAANIFAAAPGATLIPVKIADANGNLVDATGGVNTAVAQKPQVISNSWGYNIDNMTWAQLQGANPSLYAYLKTLEAAVANAVASGIVVCFSAGNCGYGFPGSHPDVISVGGVHPNYPFLSWDDLEASSYASSFDSKFYPGRHVPDLCGLVGRKTAQNTAPLIMLPVQPGSQLDLPNTGAINDGWGIFSGTSAACPQVAGVVALMREKKPGLSPAQIKQILIKSAIDVKKGQSCMGQAAAPGWDAATGAGLVNAKWAWLNTMADVAADFFGASAEAQAEMIATGQVPRDIRSFIAEMVDALRFR